MFHMTTGVVKRAYWYLNIRALSQPDERADAHRDDVRDRRAGWIAKCRQFLRNDAQFSPGREAVGDDVVTQNDNAAGRRCQELRDAADRRGLARAVRPEQPENLARLRSEADVVHRDETVDTGVPAVY